MPGHPPLPLAPPPPGPGAQVRAAARLHLGFLDPSASLGHRFGSLGLSIDGLETCLSLAPAAQDSLQADSPAAQDELPRLAQGLATLRARTGFSQPLALRLHQALPAHAGFGSGTQLALALGRAFARLHGLGIGSPQLAQWLGRGLRSGIGIAGFDAGGLVVDGGPGVDGCPAPVLARLDLPADWRVLLVQHPGQRGLSGEAERRAIGQLPPLARGQAADICHHVLMAVLPGVASADFHRFAFGINQVQALLGDHFAPAQGGSPWTSADTGRLMHWWQQQAGAALGIGQSSWGPTGFAFAPSEAVAQHWLQAAHTAGVVGPALQVSVVGPRNRGADVIGPA